MSVMKKLSDIAPHKSKTVSTKKHGSNIQRSGIKYWLTKKWVLFSLVGILLLIILVVALFVVPKILFSSDSLNRPNKITNMTYYSPITGAKVNSETETKMPVLAVMIENSPEARPQSGLAEAGVVFEAVAEGGITRFIALYQESKPELIGPVRSVRAYYLDWAAAFDANIAHVGGSPEALNMLKTGKYGADLDQSYNAGSYWRAKDRPMPHNVYTNHEKLSSLAESKGKSHSDFTGFARTSTSTTDKSTTNESATSINLAVGTGKFAVSYGYDQATNTYKRFQGGVAHLDRENGQIAPDVVVALRVNQSLQSDGTHMSIGTTGSGDCYVFQNGTVTKGTWNKSNINSQITFSDSTGQEIKLARGKTWVTAVGQGKDIRWQ